MSRSKGLAKTIMDNDVMTIPNGVGVDVCLIKKKQSGKKWKLGILLGFHFFTVK